MSSGDISPSAAWQGSVFICANCFRPMGDFVSVFRPLLGLVLGVNLILLVGIFPPGNIASAIPFLFVIAFLVLLFRGICDQASSARY